MQILVTLLLSTIFSLISFILVVYFSGKSSKKMRDEMYDELWKDKKK